MFGLVVIEGMTPSGHLSNINEIIRGSHKSLILFLARYATANKTDG